MNGKDEWIVSVIKAMYEDASTKVERVGLSMLRLGCIRARFSAHCYSLSGWRLCLENSGKAYLWNCCIITFIQHEARQKEKKG